MVGLNPESILATGWRTSWPTKVVIHGFTSNIESRIIQDIKNGKCSTRYYGVGEGAHLRHSASPRC